jgi:hypothetical protein
MQRGIWNAQGARNSRLTSIFNPPKHWAIQIVASDQMMMLLNRINWNKPGRQICIDRDELPDLAQILEIL